MNILLDTCVWGGAQDALLEHGHSVVWCGEWDEDPGDEEILAKAHAERRVLITLDKDFGELAIMRKAPHSGIIRLVDVPARKQGGIVVALLQMYPNELLAAAIITASETRVRIRLTAN